MDQVDPAVVDVLTLEAARYLGIPPLFDIVDRRLHSGYNFDKESSHHTIVVHNLPTMNQAPNSEEIATLRHVGGKIPVGAWLVALIALSERCAYYGFAAPLRKSLLRLILRRRILTLSQKTISRTTATILCVPVHSDWDSPPQPASPIFLRSWCTPRRLEEQCSGRLAGPIQKLDTLREVRRWHTSREIEILTKFR